MNTPLEGCNTRNYGHSANLFRRPVYLSTRISLLVSLVTDVRYETLTIYTEERNK